MIEISFSAFLILQLNSWSSCQIPLENQCFTILLQVDISLSNHPLGPPTEIYEKKLLKKSQDIPKDESYQVMILHKIPFVVAIRFFISIYSNGCYGYYQDNGHCSHGDVEH